MPSQATAPAVAAPGAGLDLGGVRRVFVRVPNWLGDAVMATAAFARLRAAFPEAEIVAAARPYLHSLFAGAAWFDVLLEAPKAGSAAGLLRQARALRRQRCDLAVVLPNSLETGLVAFLARIPRRLGYRQGRPLLMNLGLRAEPGRRLWPRRGARRKPTPMPEYYDALLDQLGIPATGRRTRLPLGDAEREAAAAWFRERGVPDDQPVLALSPGASYGGSKLWEPDRFAAVARHFQERHGMRAVFLCGPNEVDMVRDIVRQSGALAACDPVLPVGMLKAMLARSVAMVGTDSGPRHVAVAMGTPVVCLMGPNDRRYTDYQLDRQTVIRKDLECSPCQRKVCPLGHRRCMTDITVDEVVAATERWLP